MNKKAWLIVGLVAVLAVIGLFVYFSQKQKGSAVNPRGSPTIKSEAIGQLKNWEDPAGFSFAYPSEIAIDPHPEDEENYAHLELTSAGHQGRILIWVKETDWADIDLWAQKTSGGVQIFDTELGGKPAKKIAYSNPQKMVVATIDVDALVLIEMEPDSQRYWQSVLDQILASFKFIPLEGEPAYAETPEGQGSAPIIVEPEEVIE